jgi:hypothetical protein
MNVELDPGLRKPWEHCESAEHFYKLNNVVHQDIHQLPNRLLREKMATSQCANWRKAHSLKVAELLAEEVYRAAVADMAAVLEGTNVEAARAAVRSLTGNIPVFERNGKLYGRLTVDAAPLFSRHNPGIIEQVGSGGALQLFPQEESATAGGVDW